jgi:predicted naringenin-chalcone synthase
MLASSKEAFMFSYLHSFKPTLPTRVFKQDTLVDWVVESHARFEEMQGRECNKRRLKRFGLTESQISQRYMECPDSGTDWENHTIYKMNKETPLGMDIKSRNDFFSTRAVAIMEENYKDDKFPDHLIHVSCTGYVAPSAPQLYFSKFQNAPDITHAYHMGCYASLPSVRIASSMAIAGNIKVDVFHTEMCSLHLNPSNHIPEQMVVQTLFADGHIRYQVSQEKMGFKILGIKEQILPDTSEDMTWIPGPFGMSMTLSRHVPNKIQDHVLAFVMEMAKEQKLDLSDVIKRGIFAIHPGGPRIIDVVQKKLELKDEQVIESKKVLFDRGNMSSATLPHVWHEILKNKYPRGTPVLSLAFGPGLTVFGSLFEVV